MCGIPYIPPESLDAVQGKKLTFEQAVAHVGGFDSLLDDAAKADIKNAARQYLWKYRDKTTHCTACGHSFEGFAGTHGKYYACPACGERCMFLHEARGHKKLYDSFVYYQWRRSVLDPEAVTLTATHVTRDSTRGHVPHMAPLNTRPTALYVFRPGRAVTVYKDDGYIGWRSVNNVAQEHTKWGYKAEIVVSGMRQALEGTRIGATFEALREESGRWDTLELSAVANCARRPWLEYLHKCGQGFLAAELMRADHVSRDIVPNPRARTPRELLGLTEGQWYEARRDGVELTAVTLSNLRIISAALGAPCKVAEARAVERSGRSYSLEYLRAKRDSRYGWQQSIPELIAPLPDRLRRKIARRVLRDLAHAMEWRDYYRQLAALGEIGAEGKRNPHGTTLYHITEPNTALLLPKDMHAMHQRMIERENALKLERDLRDAEKQRSQLEKCLGALRERYCFRAAGLVLRPFDTLSEVILEGRALGICIGSYAETYARGGTVLCCLRREEEPDEPWRAVEFSPATGKLVQDRGERNDSRGIPPGVKKQLKLFWAAWSREQERKKARRST